MTDPNETHDDIDTQAIVWHVRLRSADAAERGALALWMSEDPRHAAAFDAISEAGGAREYTAEAAGMAWAERRTNKWRWLSGGLTIVVVTGLVLALSYWRTDPYDVTTKPGERRIVALDAGTKVILNGDTRMRFDRHDPRVAALIRGEALFEIRHDAARPFRLDVAGRTIEDAGTIFNVVSKPDEVRVAVADGSVIYNPDHEAVQLHPGKGLVDMATSAKIRLVDTPAGLVGGWRGGQYRYAAAPLTDVAADLSRALGVRITVVPAIASRSFTGAITLDGKGTDQLARLMPVLDARIVRTADGWAVRPLDRAGL